MRRSQSNSIPTSVYVALYMVLHEKLYLSFQVKFSSGRIRGFIYASNVDINYLEEYNIFFDTNLSPAW